MHASLSFWGLLILSATLVSSLYLSHTCCCLPLSPALSLWTGDGLSLSVLFSLSLSLSHSSLSLCLFATCCCTAHTRTAAHAHAHAHCLTCLPAPAALHCSHHLPVQSVPHAYHHVCASVSPKRERRGNEREGRMKENEIMSSGKLMCGRDRSHKNACRQTCWRSMHTRLQPALQLCLHTRHGSCCWPASCASVSFSLPLWSSLLSRSLCWFRSFSILSLLSLLTLQHAARARMPVAAPARALACSLFSSRSQDSLLSLFGMRKSM